MTVTSMSLPSNSPPAGVNVKVALLARRRPAIASSKPWIMLSEPTS